MKQSGNPCSRNIKVLCFSNTACQFVSLKCCRMPRRAGHATMCRTLYWQPWLVDVQQFKNKNLLKNRSAWSFYTMFGYYPLPYLQTIFWLERKRLLGVGWTAEWWWTSVMHTNTRSSDGNYKVLTCGSVTLTSVRGVSNLGVTGLLCRMVYHWALHVISPPVYSLEL